MDEDDVLLSVAPGGCCRQAQNVFGLSASQNRVKRSRIEMVAFANDDVTGVFNQGVNHTLRKNQMLFAEYVK